MYLKKFSNEHNIAEFPANTIKNKKPFARVKSDGTTNDINQKF